MRRLFSLVGTVALQGMREINTDISGAEKKIKEFQRELGKLGTNLSKTGAALTKNLTAPVAGLTAAVGLLSAKTGDYASRLLSLESSTRLSTDTLQEFEHVARVSGTSVDGVFNKVTYLSRSLESAASGTGKTAEALHRLGISATNADGRLRSMDDVFPEVINGLQGIKDETERNAIAFNLFGSKMGALAPIFDLTTEEMAKLRQEAHDTGKVMGSKSLQTADQFRIGVENLKATVSMLVMEFAVKLMPALKEQVIPLIETTLIPALRIAGDVVGVLAGWFGSLPAPIQKTAVIVTALVAALGPALLILGKMAIAVKSTIAAYTALKILLITSVKSALVATKAAFVKLWAIMMANPIIAIVGALTALGVAIVATINHKRQLAREVEALNRESEAFIDGTVKTAETIMTLNHLIQRMERLKGTAGYDEAELKRLRDRLAEVRIEDEGRIRAHRGRAALTELEIENIRRVAHGLRAVTAAELEVERSRNIITDRQRAEAREEAERLERLREEQRRANQQRIQDLNALVSAHADAINKIEMTEMQLLDLEEEREITRASSLRASGEHLETIRKHFALRRETLEFEHEQELVKIAQEAERTREAASQQWADKLLQQSGSRQAILEAEYQAAIAQAKAAGNDITQIELFYANERQRMQDEINARKETADKQWNDRLLRQRDDRIEIWQSEYDEALAAAKNTGADITKIHEYFAKEREKIDKEEADKRRKYFLDVVSEIANAFKNLASVLSKFSQNTEKRLTREHQQRKEMIESSVADEELRAQRLKELDEEYEAKKLALQQRQAKREKALGIFTTVVDTAKAIVKTLADLGPVAGPIMATVIGGLGIAQTAAIAAEPAPFYDGALVRGSRDGVFAQVGERHQDEVVLPLSRGTDEISDKILTALHTRSPVAAANEYHSHYHIGALIGDDNSYKLLERKMRPYRAAENRRTGVSI